MPCKITALIVFTFMTSLVVPHADAKKHKPKLQMTGHVHDQNTPLSQAVLRLYHCDATRDSCKDTPVRVTRSAADGSFSLQAADLKEGIYTLEAASAPFYLSRATVPVVLPQDEGRSFDFSMLRDVRDATGNLIGISHEDAKEIYVAARIEHNLQLEMASAKIMNQNLRDERLWESVAPKLAQSDAAPASDTSNADRDTDAEVAQSNIQSAIQKNPALADANVTVGVEHDKVNLNGSVPNKDVKDSIDRVAKENSGNVKVENHLRVASSGSSSAGTQFTHRSSIEGCLSGSSGSYTLTDTAGQTWQLVGDTSKLREHVGHQVRLSGGLEGRDSASASGTTSASPETSSPTGSSILSATFEVHKVNTISDRCESR